MKKLFLFVAAAALMTACSETEVLDQTVEQQKIESDGAVNFGVYTQRGITRGGGYTGDITNKTICASGDSLKGFGVFAYYTAGEQYGESSKPNFMYNQRIYTTANEATQGVLWKYEPVKYWPNEYGNAAISDEVDYVTFFAYAPYTDIVPTTGEIDITKYETQAAKDSAQNYNIISVKKNSATGDPIVKYIVDTNPASSVDLLWGVAAETAPYAYSAIDGAQGSTQQNKDVTVTPGLPFLNLVKPNNPQDDRLMFNLKHALAKVRFTIDYIDDAKTPEGPAKDTINADQTRIFVRSLKINGFATQGALNLNNTEPGEPLWLDFDGVKDLVFDDITFFDGRKDGGEGTVSGDVKNEKPLGLNPQIIENYGSKANGGWTKDKNTGVGSMTLTKGTDGKFTGIRDSVKYNETRKTNQGTVLLFGGDPTKNGGYFYVIPRNSKDEKVDVTITYDFETIDSLLAANLSDGLTKGISIENVITKKDILNGLDFKAGYQYDIHLHIGMTSVKIEAVVTDWKETEPAEVDLPDNQDPYVAKYWTIDGSPAIYTSNPGLPFTLSADKIIYVKDAASFDQAYANGALKSYYAWLDKYCPLDATGAATQTTNKITGTAYSKATIDWDDNDARHHSWAARQNNPGFVANGKQPWIVIDLSSDPYFVGEVEITYTGGKTVTVTRGTVTAATSAADSDPYSNEERPWVIADQSELLESGTFDKTKVTVTLTRTGVTEHPYSDFYGY